MTLHVNLQERIIRWLFHLKEHHPHTLQELTYLCKTIKTNSDNWVLYLEEIGFRLGEEPWYDEIKFAELILEQINDEGGEISIRNLLGFPLYTHGPDFDLKEWVRQRGSGRNYLRTSSAAQPSALREGDVLLTGERVLCPPREGGNGAVLVKISGRKNGTWLSFPARTAIALLSNQTEAPAGLIED